jgi:hypothetical protein
VYLCLSLSSLQLSNELANFHTFWYGFYTHRGHSIWNFLNPIITASELVRREYHTNAAQFRVPKRWTATELRKNM